MDKKEKEIIQKTTQEFLNLLEISAQPTVIDTEEGVDISLVTDDTGIIIGRYGETLESLQLLLSLVIAKKIGRFVRVSLEVGDYKKNRSSYVEQMAIRAKEKAISEQREVPLSNLKSWERRIVHLLFKEDPEVVSESVGEGKERTLLIKPR